VQGGYGATAQPVLTGTNPLQPAQAANLLPRQAAFSSHATEHKHGSAADYAASPVVPDSRQAADSAPIVLQQSGGQGTLGPRAFQQYRDASQLSSSQASMENVKPPAPFHQPQPAYCTSAGFMPWQHPSQSQQPPGIPHHHDSTSHAPAPAASCTQPPTQGSSGQQRDYVAEIIELLFSGDTPNDTIPRPQQAPTQLETERPPPSLEPAASIFLLPGAQVPVQAEDQAAPPRVLPGLQAMAPSPIQSPAGAWLAPTHPPPSSAAFPNLPPPPSSGAASAQQKRKRDTELEAQAAPLGMFLLPPPARCIASNTTCIGSVLHAQQQLSSAHVDVSLTSMWQAPVRESCTSGLLV
jgi:hypothetical protein